MMVKYKSAALVSAATTWIGQLTHTAGHISVKMNSAIDLRSRTEDVVALSPRLNVSVHPKPVSSDIYSVGMKNSTANTTSGTSAAGVPSLISAGKATHASVSLDHLRRDEGVAE